MKSSMYTSSRCRKSANCWSVLLLVQRFGGTRYSSSGCAGMEPNGWFANVSPVSQAVSDAAQKYDALSHQPIWRQEGITNCVGSSGVSLGRTYAKFHSSMGDTTMRQQPSLMSNLEKRSGPLFLGAVATA